MANPALAFDLSFNNQHCHRQWLGLLVALGTPLASLWPSATTSRRWKRPVFLLILLEILGVIVALGNALGLLVASATPLASLIVAIGEYLSAMETASISSSSS
jgi:hypothetical protein